ncbi:MAG TPA: M56 family metallopeptidase [Thermoanaerobaculia bacterium]|jgi:beta-lactamase regulating signal transducer with metallopeptidase domain|nr:M56 family metallopeptidase [Thermoanaerobaculia bacterium]
MSPLPLSFLGSPAWASASAGVLSWLGTYLLHSTILLSLAWVISRQLRGRHPLGEQAIWRAALFGSILTATLQIVTGWQPLGGALSFETGSTHATAAMATSGVPTEPTVTTIPLRTAAPPAVRPEFSAVARTPVRALSSAATSPPWAWLALAWSLVAAALLIRWTAAHAALSRRLRPRLELVDGTLFRTLRRLRAEAGFDSAVRLTCAHRLSVPIALGLKTPEICLPPRALSHLDEREGESLLAHELAHLARRDPAALNLTQIAASLFFFQPLVWLARRKLYDLSELLADDWAISRTGRPLSLARCLAAVACWSVHERRLPVPSMAESSSPLGHRIRRLLGELRPSRRLPVWALPVCGLVLVAFAAVAPAVSARAKQEPNESKTRVQEAQEPNEPARDREEYRRPQPQETYVHESPRTAGDETVFSEDEERELGEHAEELAAQLAEMGKGWDGEEFGREMAKLGHDFQMSGEDRAKLAGEIDALVARTVPDRAALDRLTAQAAKLADLKLSPEERERMAAEIGRLAADMRPSEAEIAEIQRRAREMAPSTEEARRMAADARRMADAHRPSAEQLAKIREQSRKYEQEVRQIVERHRGEFEKIQREMEQKLEEMQERLQEDIERNLGADEQGLRDQAHRPRVPRAPRPPRPVVAPAPETPPAPGTPSSPPRVALAPLPPGTPSPHSFPVPRVAPTPGVPTAPPAPRTAPTLATAPTPRPTPAPRALPAPAPEAPEVVEPPEPGEPVEAPEAVEPPEPPPAHGR